MCRALLLAASVQALSVAMARAQDLHTLNDQILQDPQDIDLNLEYARLAEQGGKLRLALAAYERILINHPDNEEAQRGYTRVRRIIEPPYTSVQLEVGTQWDSNPRNFHGADEDAASLFAHATVVDERRLGSQRWRTAANLESDFIPAIDELNYDYLGAQTGPIVDIAPNLDATPAVGVAVAALGDNYYFSEVSAGVTLEGQREGVSFWARSRVAWRSYGSDSTAEEGPRAEIAAGVSIPRIASDSDSLAIVPWLRWSGVEGNGFNYFNEEVAPGQYTEYGVDASYRYQFNDNIIVSGGALAYERRYSHTEVGGDKRHDLYIAPQASVTFQNLLPCACAIKATYRYRSSDSNDPDADYDANQFSLSLLTRF